MPLSSTELTEFCARLRHALSLTEQPSACQRDFAPQLAYGRHWGPPLPGVRQGAVLVLFFPADNNSPAGNDWATVLTVRATHLSSHAGQVSFPGGRCDLGETAEQAALREYREELGEPGDLIVVGSLPPIHVFASNFHVTPVIAVVQKRPRFAPHAGEVAAVLEVPLSCLFDVNLRGAHEIVRGPLHFRTPHFEYGGHRVWGATWIILGDLLNRLHQTND